jgi:hypothetical protein
MWTAGYHDMSCGTSNRTGSVLNVGSFFLPFSSACYGNCRLHFLPYDVSYPINKNVEDFSGMRRSAR